MEYGMMPGNLWFHKDTPNPDSLGLKDGTLEVRFLAAAPLHGIAQVNQHCSHHTNNAQIPPVNAETQYLAMVSMVAQLSRFAPCIL